jgi:tRNA(fMet)-specific endonuclease VapC
MTATAPALVLDTDVVSYLYRRDPRSVPYRPIIAGKVGLLSFQTVAELHVWPRRNNWGEARTAHLEKYVQGFVKIESTPELAIRWAEVIVAAERGGKPMSAQDAWVAATALELGVPVVTNNDKHFNVLAGIGLQILTAKQI